MATQAILYTLDVGGNATKTVPGLAQSLGQVEKKAKDAQVAASKIGGGSSLTSARAAFGGIADESKKAAEGAFKFAGMLAIAGLAVNKLLEDQEAWRNATGVLRDTLAGMADDLAEAVGPAAAEKVGAFTVGLRFLASFAANGLVPAMVAVYKSVSSLVTDGFGGLLTMIERIKSGDVLGAISAYTDTVKTGLDEIMTLADEVPAALTAGLDQALADARETWTKIQTGAGKPSGGGAPAQSFASVATMLPGQTAQMKALTVSLNSVAGLLDPQIAATQDAIVATGGMVDALDGMAAQLSIGANQARLDGGANQVMGGLDALQGGLGGILSAAGAGPVGAAVAAVAAALPEIPGMLTGLADQVLSLAVDLPNTLTTILMDVVPQIVEKLPLIAGALITAAPRMVAALVAAIPELIAAFISAGPQILVGIIDAFKELPKAFFQAIQRMVTELPSAIGAALAGLLNPLKDGDGKFLGTDLTAGKGKEKLFGINLPSFDTGGVVTRTGIATVHAGERVLNQQEARGGGRGGISIGSITVVAPDPRRFVEELRRLQGNYGVNLSLDPLV